MYYLEINKGKQHSIAYEPSLQDLLPTVM